MILYTSGTGNTEWAARELGKLLNDRAINIAHDMKKCPGITYMPTKGRMILMFPVHSWGPALMIERFLGQAEFKNVKELWAVMTCGDMCCNADKILKKILHKHKLRLNGCFSVQMPNNYILMKGFGIDAEDVAEKKLREAPERLQQIARAITLKKADGSLYTRGNHPAIKSWVYKLFKAFAVKKVKFHVDKERCINCSLCSKVCPTRNITIVDGLPQWSKDCTQCTACINRCPAKAIEYGNVTQNAGRYHHPDAK